MAQGRKHVIRNGDRFGRLIVIRKAGRVRGQRGYRCECECGHQTTVPAGALYSGNTRSCGCWIGRTHGLSSHPLHRTWVSMRQRCRDPKTPNYRDYGGRGVRICSRWDDFMLFLADVGEKPGPGYELDRVDNDGDYEPGNVRWATRSQNQRNKRRPPGRLVLRDNRRVKHG